jgi:pyridoxine 4-dehydrogenase
MDNILPVNTSFLLGGNLPINRLGFGAMRITGPELYGPPADRPGMLALLRRAMELGVTFIDTADMYGPSCRKNCWRRHYTPTRTGW